MVTKNSELRLSALYPTALRQRERYVVKVHVRRRPTTNTASTDRPNPQNNTGHGSSSSKRSDHLNPIGVYGIGGRGNGNEGQVSCNVKGGNATTARNWASGPRPQSVSRTWTHRHGLCKIQAPTRCN
jgi:hypothetical protein